MAGKLSLIGCGPGAVDLLTLRAIRRIQAADLILYDRLVNSEILQFARPGAAIVNVGKRTGDGGHQQVDINQRIEAALAEGLTVTRLKSGDPLIFGRAAEELAIALDRDCEIEIVPGITASLAAASEAMIPVTERSELRSFVVTTGHVAAGSKAPDWLGAVRPGTCVAVYMGVARASHIQSMLLAAGLPGHLPADWVERAGHPDRRIHSTRLDRFADDARDFGIQNPAILLLRYPLSAKISLSVTAPAAMQRETEQATSKM